METTVISIVVRPAGHKISTRLIVIGPVPLKTTISRLSVHTALIDAFNRRTATPRNARSSNSARLQVRTYHDSANGEAPTTKGPTPIKIVTTARPSPRVAVRVLGQQVGSGRLAATQLTAG